MKRLLTAARRKLIIEFIKFGTVGVFGFGVDTGLLYVGIDLLGLTRIEAGLFSFPFAATFTWFGNRIFTYGHKTHDSIGAQWGKFLIVCAFGLVFNRGTYSLLVTHVPIAFEFPVLALLGGTATGMLFNFFAVRRLVFS
jgi:putative flippase GtrA